MPGKDFQGIPNYIMYLWNRIAERIGWARGLFGVIWSAMSVWNWRRRSGVFKKPEL
jgi:hypothetical protein